MADHAIVICGLPESGKTTFLAALWHLVTSREIDTTLRFGSLRNGDASHLNAIAARWRNAEVQDRTEVASNRVVSMNLVRGDGELVRVFFPDLSGEVYRRMWEDRDCDPDVADILCSGSAVLLFAHADRIQAPQWVVDEAALMEKLGLPVSNGQEIPWHPRLAPTQVQMIDLLQLLRTPPLDIGPRRLALMLSAWDKVAPEGRTPEGLLRERLALLDQYLRQGADGWRWRVYGVSAQGGDFATEADVLRAKTVPSTRIRLVDERIESHDLTEPLAWLME